MNWENVIPGIMTGAAAQTTDPAMDSDQFAAFYERSSRQLWAYLARTSGDAALADDLMQETIAFAQRLADGPPLQTRDIKKLMYQSQRTDLRTSLETVASHMAVVQSTRDYKEAILAYKEKRKPVFEGR